jgi:hypothetical protein
MIMTSELLYGINEWLLFVVILGILYSCAEIGFLYGRRFDHRTTAEIHSHIATVEGALLGLLALLLGFAFAMAVSRYETRKQVVLEEANDLQTTFLRAQLLPSKYSKSAMDLLEQYVQTRLESLRAGSHINQIKQAQVKTKQVQIQLWAIARAAAKDDPNEVTTGYFIESLNHLIDDHTKRSIAMQNHVPEVILYLLLLVAAFTISVTGYSSGLRRKRLKALRVILTLLISATMLVIIDLDRPRRGLIQVSEDSFVNLQSDLGDFRPKD